MAKRADHLMTSSAGLDGAGKELPAVLAQAISLSVPLRVGAIRTEPRMEPDDFFRNAAKGICDLINKLPWSPTLDEIAQVIEEAWWQSPAISEKDLNTLVDAAEKRRRRLRRQL
jgi:hypothetical protein